MPSLWCASPEGGNLQTFLQTCKLYKRMVCIHFGSAPTAPSPSPIPHHIESWEICEVPTGAHIRAIRNTRAGDKRKKHSNRNKYRTKTAKKILFFFFSNSFFFLSATAPRVSPTHPAHQLVHLALSYRALQTVAAGGHRARGHEQCDARVCFAVSQQDTSKTHTKKKQPR
jgi:hypothetical protein